MSNLTIGIALLSAMLLLMGLRVPIAIAMFVPGAIGYALLSSPEALLNHLQSAPFARLSVYDLSVIPLFLLMGQFAAKGGLSRALFELAAAFIGHRRGGMASASVLACAAFGSICGSSVATAATVSQVALPEMRRHNYSGRLATATMAAGGTLGIFTPPSVPLVVYTILAEQNIAKLFAAAFISGFLAALLYPVAIKIYVSVGESGFAPVAIVAAVLAFYIVLGCVMDELAMLLLTIPIIFAVVIGLDLFGLDATSKALWFGILVLYVVEIGLIAPPVGLNVYVVHSFARDVSMRETCLGVIPYLAADAVRIALLFAFPILFYRCAWWAC